jgi:NADH dehydrogenase
MLGAALDGAGRVRVGPDLSVPGRSEVFVAGDLAATEAGAPGIAPAAMQMGRFAGRVIRAEAEAALHNAARPERPAFRYRDKGMLATIGRSRAVAAIGGRRFAGWFAWMLWLVVHIYFLIGFRNRALVLFQWAWAWLTFQRGARLITRERRDLSP